jgi:hypothetical protein
MHPPELLWYDPQLWCDPQVIEFVVNNRLVLASLGFGTTLALTVWGISRSTRVVDGATGILFSFSEHRAIESKVKDMSLEVNGIIELAKICAGSVDPLDWIKTLEGALRIAHLRGSSNDAFSQHWVSPRSANDENAAVMVVAVEWTKSKAHSSTEFVFFTWKTKKTLFKGEYYVIRAETAKAKSLIRGIQNVGSVRKLYHKGIQKHFCPELESYVDTQARRNLAGQASRTSS